MKTDNDLVNFPKSRAWKARWIWHDHAPARNAWVLFRKEFILDHAEAVTVFISADTRYRLWINGQWVGDGPIQSQPYHQYYDERDLTAFVRQGPNCMAVLVQHQGVQQTARGGLLAELVDAQGRPLAATGGDWRTQVGKAWRSNTQFFGANKIGPFQEHCDLRLLPVGWQATGFDDSIWQPATEIASNWATQAGQVMPWCRLIPRDIEFLEMHARYPRAIQTLEECLDLANRHRSQDLSPSLSQAGRPIAWATATGVENLLRAGGETRLACSTRHEDGVTDGRYDPCITLDFGRVVTAYAEVEVETKEAGARIEIGYAERLVDGRFVNVLECPFADCVILAKGRTRFRPLVWRAFRYLRLRVKEAQAGVRLKAVCAREVAYPYQARGGFRGNPRLERIYDMCQATVRLCSIESIMDTPFREQAQWLGDVAAVTLPCIYACFGDYRLPGKFLRQAAMNTRPTGLIANISNVASDDWQNDIPDYSLWWVIALWRHYLVTGDVRYLHECYPELQRIMRTHLERINGQGLLDPMFGWVFIDWAPVDVKGMSSAYNALFAGACDAAAAVAAVKGDDWARQVYERAARGVRAAFADVFVDPRTGLVADAVVDGLRSRRISEHGNAAAVAFDCVAPRVASRIIGKVFDRRTAKATEAQPFFMVVVLDALRKTDRLDLALRLIEERWGQRMLDRGRTSCTEEWYENGSWRNGSWQGFERTHSHAWSASAAAFLVTGLTGLTILEPGCGRLRLSPYQAPFPYTVNIPVPQGEVVVKWDGRRVGIKAPAAVTVETAWG